MRKFCAFIAVLCVISLIVPVSVFAQAERSGAGAVAAGEAGAAAAGEAGAAAGAATAAGTVAGTIAAGVVLVGVVAAGIAISTSGTTTTTRNHP